MFVIIIHEEVMQLARERTLKAQYKIQANKS